MIPREWKKILEGKELFVDKDAEVIAKEILSRIQNTTDVSTLIDLYNDLELVMGKGEWMARSIKKMEYRLYNEPLFDEDKQHYSKRIPHLSNIKQSVVYKLKEKYNLQ